jgi:hypothetical protein
MMALAAAAFSSVPNDRPGFRLTRAIGVIVARIERAGP